MWSFTGGGGSTEASTINLSSILCPCLFALDALQTLDTLATRRRQKFPAPDTRAPTLDRPSTFQALGAARNDLQHRVTSGIHSTPNRVPQGADTRRRPHSTSMEESPSQGPFSKKREISMRDVSAAPLCWPRECRVQQGPISDASREFRVQRPAPRDELMGQRAAPVDVMGCITTGLPDHTVTAPAMSLTRRWVLAPGPHQRHRARWRDKRATSFLRTVRPEGTTPPCTTSRHHRHLPNSRRTTATPESVIPPPMCTVGFMRFSRHIPR